MASNKTITTVIFDLGQVIVTFDHMQLCQRAAACCPHAPEEIFTRMFHSGLVHRFETGAMDPNEFYREVCRTLDMQLPCEQFKTVWNTIFTLNTDTVRIIERLSGFKRLLLSNTNCWHFDYCLESYPVLKLFDDWILSYEVGVCKPDKKIFETALAAQQPGRRNVFLLMISSSIRMQPEAWALPRTRLQAPQSWNNSSTA